ncbi:MAG: cytochrome c [Candidatus Manganitrophus sp.]|nr:MAG: cytochrome c [Candidatus Manganitrophus sp.]
MSRSPHPFTASSSTVTRGETIFMHACNQCHPKGEAGLGPALNNKPLPAFMIRFQVRHGLGAMPAFSKKISATGISIGSFTHT